MIPFVNLANPLPTTPGTGLTAGQEADLATATRRQPVASIAVLKSLTPSAGDAVNVLGYYASGDGGGGLFRYDGASSATDNGGTIIAPTAGSGRWLRVFSGAASVKWFGAKGDGTTDDTTAIQAALNAELDVSIPAGTFNVTSLSMSRNQRLTGVSYRESILAVKSFGTYVSLKYGILIRGKTSGADNFDISHISDLKIQIDSNESGQHGLLITKSVNAERLWVNEAPGDGVYFRSVDPAHECPYFSRFDDVKSSYSGGNGFSITDNCNGITLNNCQGFASGGHGMYVGVVDNGQTAATLSTHIQGGQNCYNQKHGIFIDRAWSTVVMNVYFEGNSAIDTGNATTGAYGNVALSSLVQYTMVVLGSIGTDEAGALSSCRWNGQVTNTLYMGGSLLTGMNDLFIGVENSGTGRKLTLRSEIGNHHIVFRKATWDGGRVTWDADQGSVSLQTSYDSVTFTSGITYSYDYKLGFFNSVGTTKPTVTGSRGSNAALASLLTALAGLGLITDSSS